MPMGGGPPELIHRAGRRGPCFDGAGAGPRRQKCGRPQPPARIRLEKHQPARGVGLWLRDAPHLARILRVARSWPQWRPSAGVAFLFPLTPLPTGMLIVASLHVQKLRRPRLVAAPAQSSHRWRCGCPCPGRAAAVAFAACEGWSGSLLQSTESVYSGPALSPGSGIEFFEALLRHIVS
ncbi:unnamed protein product [Amoebophrya sp. A120]|nr:unnamed protein product [Amoebophrya sp. A120]|eukprot:GSA120T00015846001.1